MPRRPGLFDLESPGDGDGEREARHDHPRVRHAVDHSKKIDGEDGVLPEAGVFGGRGGNSRPGWCGFGIEHERDDLRLGAVETIEQVVSIGRGVLGFEASRQFDDAVALQATVAATPSCSSDDNGLGS